jgi:hypothetical protein
MKETKRETNRSSEIPNPRFHGDKKLLIKAVEKRDCHSKIIPKCFSDPLLESGVCNPLLPLKKEEPHLCAFHKSCLVALLISHKVSAGDIIQPGQSYEELLAIGDEIFDVVPPEPTVGKEEDASIRQKLRAHIVSMNLAPVKNPFRKNSLRNIILDVLSRDWISLNDLCAAVIALKPGTKCLDLVIGQVTNIATQEQMCYRIVEAFGKYRAFGREDKCTQESQQQPS